MSLLRFKRKTTTETTKGLQSVLKDLACDEPMFDTNTDRLYIDKELAGETVSVLQPYVTCYMWKRTE